MAGRSSGPDACGLRPARSSGVHAVIVGQVDSRCAAPPAGGSAPPLSGCQLAGDHDIEVSAAACAGTSPSGSTRSIRRRRSSPQRAQVPAEAGHGLERLRLASRGRCRPRSRPPRPAAAPGRCRDGRGNRQRGLGDATAAGPAAGVAQLDQHGQRPASSGRGLRRSLEQPDAGHAVGVGEALAARVGGQLARPARLSPARSVSSLASRIRRHRRTPGRPAPRPTLAAVMAQAPASSWRAKSCGAIVVLPCGASLTPAAAH